MRLRARSSSMTCRSRKSHSVRPVRCNSASAERDCLMVKAKSQAKPDDKKWSKMFIEKAREIGAYEKSSASDQLAKMKPDPTPS